MRLESLGSKAVAVGCKAKSAFLSIKQERCYQKSLLKKWIRVKELHSRYKRINTELSLKQGCRDKVKLQGISVKTSDTLAPSIIAVGSNKNKVFSYHLHVYASNYHPITIAGRPRSFRFACGVDGERGRGIITT